MTHHWRTWSSAALDMVLPPRCLRCEAQVGRNGTLCASCWEGFNFLAPPFCELCGFPFEYEAGAGTLCAACAGGRPAFDRARAVMRYDDDSRDLLLSFKHRDRTEGARAFAAWMARAGADLLRDCDLIVPVPLHWTRLFQRRYNQASLLANALGRLAGLPVDPEVLQRSRATASQGHLSPAARSKNVSGAFRVSRTGKERLSGRHVLLVDDVMTTGATVSACSRTLKRAGAAGVEVLALARVIRPRATAWP